MYPRPSEGVKNKSTPVFYVPVFPLVSTILGMYQMPCKYATKEILNTIVPEWQKESSVNAVHCDKN